VVLRSRWMTQCWLTTCTHACRTFLRTIAARIQTLVTLDAYAAQCTPKVLTTLLILLARCEHRDLAVARSICNRLLNTPDKQLASLSNLSGFLWAHAVLLLPDPVPLLDHCMLSAPGMLHPYQKGTEQQATGTDVKASIKRGKSLRLPNQVPLFLP
jgi:hypothetical protein